MFCPAVSYSIETLAARVAQRGNIPAGKLVRASGECRVAATLTAD